MKDQGLWMLLVGAVVAWMAFDALSLPAPPPDANRFVGAWSSEPGADDAVELDLWFEKTVLPDATFMGDAVAWDGHMTSAGLGVVPSGEARWNYGGWDPLVLNVVWEVGPNQRGSASLVVAIGDGDHLRVRAMSDAAAAMVPGAIEHPDTLDLVRVGPPKGDVPPQQ